VSYPWSLPQDMKLVLGLAPQHGAALSSDYVSLKLAHKLWAIVIVNQGNAAQMAITLEQATDVAGTGHIPLVNAVPIWLCEDADTSDALVRQTDAVALTLTVGVTKKIVVFEIDPALFTLANADCLKVVTAASHADNQTCVLFLLATRYPSETPPSAIVD